MFSDLEIRRLRMSRRIQRRECTTHFTCQYDFDVSQNLLAQWNCKKELSRRDFVSRPSLQRQRGNTFRRNVLEGNNIYMFVYRMNLWNTEDRNLDITFLIWTEKKNEVYNYEYCSTHSCCGKKQNHFFKTTKC